MSLPCSAAQSSFCDPSIRRTPDEFKQRLDFLLQIRDKLPEIHETVKAICEMGKQADDFVTKLEKHPAKDTVTATVKRLNRNLSKVEEELIQVKIRSGQDALNFPTMLNDRLAGIASDVGSADAKPIQQSPDPDRELSAEIDEQLATCRGITETDLPMFKKLIKEQGVSVLYVKPAERNR